MDIARVDLCPFTYYYTNRPMPDAPSTAGMGS